MTPQELKNSILQLAVQGKLIEQRPDEGTAEELYKQIQAEKQALIKAGKIKKEKPLPEITEDEIPFEIPESWKWVRVGQAFSTIMGQSPDGNSVVDGGTGVEFHQGKIYFSKVIIDKSPQTTNAPTKIAPANSLLLCVRAPVGKVNITDRELCIGRGLSAIICHAGVSITFAFYWIQTLESSFIKKSTGTTFKAISADIINNQVIPLPPLAEQKRIVAKIEELLPLIERYEKAWSRLEDFNKRFPVDMQKSILQMAIQGKLVEQRPEEGTGEELYRRIQAEKQALIKAGKIKKEKPLPEITEDEIPFEIPESWKWVRFLSVVEIATNLVQPERYRDYKHIAPDNIEKGTGKLFECKTVAEDKVSSANHLFHQGQIIYSKIRPLLRKAVIAPFDGLCSADMYPLNTQLDSSFLLHFLLSDAFNHQIALAMSSRVKMPKINQDELGKVLLPLPPLAEQKRIVARLEELLPLCERLK